jgi:hypothetical protein
MFEACRIRPEYASSAATPRKHGKSFVSEHEMPVRRILAAYEQIVARACSHDIKVIGATLLPFLASDFYRPGPRSEADRQAVNEWIREPRHFDAVMDPATLSRHGVRIRYRLKKRSVTGSIAARSI